MELRELILETLGTEFQKGRSLLLTQLIQQLGAKLNLIQNKSLASFCSETEFVRLINLLVDREDIMQIKQRFTLPYSQHINSSRYDDSNSSMALSGSIPATLNSKPSIKSTPRRL
jgi:hypothetical protein